MRDGDRETFRTLIAQDAELRAATRDVVTLFDARFAGFVEPGDYQATPIEWPDRLSCGDLRERPASKSARCRLAGCKGDEMRVYEKKTKTTTDEGKTRTETDSWTLCLLHAMDWKSWDDTKGDR